MPSDRRTDKKLSLQDAEARWRNLFLEAVAGNEEKYLVFLNEVALHLRGYFRKRLPQSGNDVEDLVQETLLAVHIQRHTYDSQRPLTVWMHAIASYKLVDRWRAHGSRELLTEPLEGDDEAIAFTDREATDARIDIHSLLARLPDRYRLPILHVKLNGISIAEAAAASGMSESAVKVGVHRGLKLLAKLIRSTQ
ncbi:MAG: sigma-70 family RNA polymerase sigma factor [Pseudomonadota bacterium]